MQIKRRFSKTFAAVLMTALTAALLAAGALGAEQTRESYVAQVEPICKKNTKANEQILAGVEKTIRQGKFTVRVNADFEMLPAWMFELRVRAYM